MTTESITRVDVNGTQLDVPMYVDHETTQALADQVTATIKTIEESSERIDTQRFALEACMKFAVDLAAEREKAATAQDEIGVQMASVNTSVESLLKLLE
jgi:cell division protein ZapA (FtsZ GTPase activity inhibitor)